MDSIIALGSACWLGILTSISPCPLATNIAAISFLSRDIKSSSRTISSGLFYAIGRIIVYFGLALIIMKSLGTSSTISNFLQTHFNKIVGPILVLVGMYLIDLLTFDFIKINLKSKVSESLKYKRIFGSIIIGIIFALSFCPVSAAIYFGGLIPLAITNSSPVLIPIFYGLGTALPVLIISILLTTGIKSAGRYYNRLTRIEKWSRYITGYVFLLIGIYLSLVYIFKLNL